MTVRQIFTKIGNFIENRQIFMLLNCNCAKLANFEVFKHAHGQFFRAHGVVFKLECFPLTICFLNYRQKERLCV